MCGGPEHVASGLHQRGIQRPARSGSDADLAAGPVRQHISLSEPGRLPSYCCWIPGVILFSMMLIVVVAALVSSTAFYAITALLTIFTLSYSTQLSVSCAFGAWKMRRACREDWDERLKEMQENTGLAIEHIVILPNYQEDEQMLQHTLENIGRSSMARENIRVVLAMEAREVEAQPKAERLIANTKHLFAGIMAAYHPEGVPGEIAGKSSNTQWAYRSALQHWGMLMSQHDPSQVLLTVGDADTLWHPQFFSALACEALSLTAAERAWAIWQPPVLLLRNLFSVPGPTRVSGYATILFELAGLANQYFGTHFCYSAYSLSLALASHPLVSGWDRDVIAEDHHMFCKCYFASIRDTMEASPTAKATGSTALKATASKAAQMVPKVKLHPVYLPAISYLVESSDGWLASVHARFQQARRHSQGIAELSYVLLQYAHLLRETGIWALPARTHSKILGIAAKMGTVHIVNQVQALALVFASLMLVPGAVYWVWSGGLSATFHVASSVGYFKAIWAATGGLGGLLKYLLAIFGPIPPMGLLMTATTTLVIMDVLEGRLTQTPGQKEGTKDYLTNTDVQGAALISPGSKTGSASFGFMGRLKLFLHVQNDYFSMAHFTLLAYGLLPVSLAAWSLLRRGHKFEYIVAAKPN